MDDYYANTGRFGIEKPSSQQMPVRPYITPQFGLPGIMHDPEPHAWPERPVSADYGYVWQYYNPDYTTRRKDLTKESKPMSINEKIAAERREKRERARVEALWEGYDIANFTDLNNGSVIAFEWSPTDSEKTYSYAAVLAHGRWYATGDLAPRNADPETFIAWLIDKNISVGEIEILREV